MIVTISRIQHRMGLQEDLPQLAAGELGWAIDSRRLFIGNGAVADGAPPAYATPNNTEIITEHSIASLISSFPLYQYEGNGTITLITGPDALNPVYRTIQDRLDDYVSVKAFGAKGDGTTDDTDAINRALYELYVHDNTLYNKKTLLFPAGEYIISGDKIKVPTNAQLLGEGIDNTIITQTDTAIDCVMYFADGLQQTAGDIGTNGAVYPGNNTIYNMTIRHTNRLQDVVKIDMADNVTFDNCAFVNVWTTGDGGTSGAQAVDIRSTDSAHLSKSIKFYDCHFNGVEYANKLDYDTMNVSFSNCEFIMCYGTHYIGENIGALSQVKAAYGYRIIDSYFDKIYATAIKTYPGVDSVVSIDNHFNDVGSSNDGLFNYDYHIIDFGSSGNSSISDHCERTDSSDVIKQVNVVGSESIVVSSNNGIYLNKWQNAISTTLTLNDNNSPASTTGIAHSYTYVPAMKINYRINRNNIVRFGELIVTAGPGGLSLTDSYDEPDASVGVTFSVVSTGGTNYEIRYLTTNTGFSATFEYQVNAYR